MTLSREIVWTAGLILFVVMCGNWGLEAKIAKDEMKYVCPEAAAAVNGFEDFRKINRLHAAYKDLDARVFGFKEG